MKTDEATKITELKDLVNKGIVKFNSDYWISGNENKRLRRGQNWTESELTDHTDQGMKAYSMPTTVAKFNGLEAQQMLSPFDVKILPRSTEWEIQAEVKNAIHKDIFENQELESKLADWYRAGLGIKYGVIKREYDYNEHLEGDVKISKVQFDRFIWDDNCREYDISRYAKWVAEIGYSTREELESTYPEKIDLIKKIPNAQEERRDESLTNWYRNDTGTELVRWVRFEERKFKKIWKVTYNNGKVEESDTMIKLDGLPPQEQWSMDAQRGMLYPISTFSVTKEWIECYVFTQDVPEFLDHKTYQSKLFNYHVFASYYCDGDVACLMDWCKYPQRFIDRTTSQFDKSLGLLIKNSYQVNWDALRKEDKDNWFAIEKKLTQGGAVIFTHGREQAIFAIGNDSRVPPDIFQAYQYAVTILEETTGGRVSQGLPDRGNSQQSGKYVEALQQAGYSMAYMFIYNLRRSYKSLVEGIDEQIIEIFGQSIERVISITDNDLDELVMKAFENNQMTQRGTLNPNRVDLKITPNLKLKEAKTRIMITKGNYAPTLKEQKKEMWAQINADRINAGEQPYPTSIWIDDAYEVPPTIKNKMQKFEEEQQKIAEQQRQMEMGQAILEGNNQTMDKLKQAHDSLSSNQQQGFDNQMRVKENAGNTDK